MPRLCRSLGMISQIPKIALPMASWICEMKANAESIDDPASGGDSIAAALSLKERRR